MQRTVKRRYVLYVAGFDPTGPAHYHRLYKEQATLQAAVHGYTMEVGERHKCAEHLAMWQVKQTQANGPELGDTETDYVFARWDDIVREHWGRFDSFAHILRFAASFFATQWHNLRTGAIWQMLRLAWPPVVALILPLLLIFTALVVWTAAPWLGATLLNGFGLRYATGAKPMYVSLVLVFWIFASLILVWLVQRIEKKIHMLWLMRSYMFTRLLALARVPALDARVQVFAEAIAKARHSGLYDEVLVVGHSSGCTVAASSLAESLSLISSEHRDDGSKPPIASTALGFVTLGHCMPLLSSLPSAQNFRAQLQTISLDASISWVDFSAPSDGCCFAFVDGIAAAFPHQQAGLCAPTLLSPRFQTLFSDAQYRTLRRNRFDLHFQYIKAAPLPGDYDYFAISVGGSTLRERFAGQRSVVNFTKFRLFG
jgi:hypothetical protein